MALPDRPDPRLEERIAELESELERVTQRAKDVAAANARAAMHMVARNEELELQGQALAQALQSAEVAAQRKDDFLAKVSHELRTPMNGVLGLLQCLLAESLPVAQRQTVETALHSARALLQLIEELLDFSRVRGGLEVRAERFDLWRLLEGTHRLFRTLAEEVDLELELDLDPRVPREVIGDEGRVRQVVANLVANAIKFTDEGRVRVTCTPAPHGSHVRLEVSDTGRGIAPGDLERVFEPFEQVDNSPARQHTGVGLGLAIVREIARAMGGTSKSSRRSGTAHAFGWTSTCRLLPRRPSRGGKRDSSCRKVRSAIS